jgi:2-dehydro-3-deoxygalactonokinase
LIRDARFVAGDWGTSNLRLFLCDAQGGKLEEANGPGAAEVNGRFASTFTSLTARWVECHGPLPAVLCGMVGSSLGWTRAPYVPCPAKPEQIADACVSLQDGAIAVVPGLSCHNRFNAPDFLRGEETQVLGALSLDPEFRHGRRIICLPGTHTKWVVVEDGWVREFFTAPTGELFGILRAHSVLIRGAGHFDGSNHRDAFEKGLAQFNAFPQAQLLHRLFESRSRQLSGELEAPAAAAYLSGLLVASDVQGALRVLSDSMTARTLLLVGAPHLMQLYSKACAFEGYDTRELDGAAASLSGLFQVHRRLQQGDHK